MKFDFKILLLAGIILILISGATSPTSCQKSTGTTFNSTGLLMDFIEDAPPKLMTTGQQYPIYLDIQNQGGADIQQGQAAFYLTGVGENLQNIEFKKQNTNILSKKSIYQDGGKERIIFSQGAKPWKNLPNPYNITMKIDSCYNYATVTQTVICIGSKDDICTISGDKIITQSNSAGPIQVTSMTEQVQGNKLYLTFKLENKGVGEVYSFNSDCDKLENNDLNEKTKKDLVNIQIETESGFSCTLQNAEAPYGQKQGTEGLANVGAITCVKILGTERTYSTPIQIVLTYKYFESLAKTMTILPA
ncbi:hypothetical protein J4465_00605 [Candidatus Pacearchaeota archaeon]|nr:hypothetical protein [Candidatus Pacearchaeota archaeon]